MNHSSTEVTMRPAEAGDQQRLLRLAALDSAVLGDGPFLLAESAGELRAALSLADGHVLADPFARTAELVSLLRVRAAQTAVPAERESRPPRGGRRLRELALAA